MASTSRSARYAKWLSIPLGLVISAVLIWQASYAAFTVSQEITGELGTANLEVTLKEDAMTKFEALNLLPGETFTHEVEATYSGTVDADVRFYVGELNGDRELAENLQIDVSVVSNGQRATATAPSLFAFATDFSQTATTWNAPVSENQDISATLTITLTLDENASSELMSKSVEVVFVGEATATRRTTNG